MAFGTGTHETTRLCMSMLEKYLVPGCKMLDVGTGSGILAVAGAKMGAERVCAYDIDPVAVRVANENFAVNGVDDRVICGVSDLLLGVDRAEAPFTLVCANIVADILIRMAPDIASFMAVGGKLIASGIIEGRKEDVKAAMIKGGLAPIDSDEEKDWCALVFERR
jgi:ribosomal protein L11 methyltransferase